ncbi:MAG: ATP synthase F0 subunit B [Candidatus Acidiferrales bacterium]
MSVRMRRRLRDFRAWKRTVGFAGFLGVWFALMAAPALGQESETSGADSTTGWVFRWLNFAIVFGAIGYFAVKKGAPYFRTHAEEISEKIAEGARAREAAEKQRREAQAKLEGIEKEVSEMRVEAKRAAEAEIQRILALAGKDKVAVERGAQAEIAAAERAARLGLKAHGARLAVERAEEALRGAVAPDAEAKLFREFVAGIGGSVN